MRYVVGIDAGGTKTVALLADETGTVRARARSGGANLLVEGEQAVERALAAALGELRPPGRIAAACLGIAGADRPGEQEVIHGVLRRVGLVGSVRVVHDAEIALVAGAPQGYGIVVVAGTGSIAYGVDPQGRTFRSGGWGHLLGDEGSAFWLGREILRRALQAVDGRGAPTSLVAKVEQRLGIQIPAGLVSWTHDQPSRRDRVAELVPLLQEAVEEGDRIALAILEEGARHLVAAATAVANGLSFPGTFPLVLSGGAFLALPSLYQRMEALLELPAAQIARLESEPARGAVTLALELLG